MVMGPAFEIGWSSRNNNFKQKIKDPPSTTTTRQVQQDVLSTSSVSSNKPRATKSRDQNEAMEVKGRSTKNGTLDLCDMHPRYCLNNGICSVNVNGQMQCWCPSTARLWYRGDHCETAESVVKVSAIAAGCGSIFLILIILLTLRIAKLTVRIENSERRSASGERAFPGLGLPLGADNNHFSGVQLFMSPVSPVSGRHSNVESISNATPSVRYSQLSTITKDGEGRTRFTSNRTSNTETVSSETAVESKDRNITAHAREAQLDCRTNDRKYQTTGIVL